MKISNIILIITSIVVILFCYYSVLSSKPAELLSQQIKGNGELIEKSITTPNLHTIILDRSINYHLDPHSDRTIIKSDKNILNQLSLEDVNGTLNFNCLFSDTCNLSSSEIHTFSEPVLFHKYKPSQYPEITIGLKGIDELTLICINSGFIPNQPMPKIESSDTLQLNKIIFYSGNFATDIIVNVESLHLYQHGFSKAKISGIVQNLLLHSELRGKVDASNLHSCNASLSIDHSCEIEINSDCELSGFADFNSKIRNHSAPSKNTLVLNSAKYTEI